MARTCTAIDSFAASTTAAGSRCAHLCRIGQGPAGRQVAVERIVRAGLVGDHVRPDAALQELREDLGGVAEQADGERPCRPSSRLLEHRQRLVERGRLGVEIAGLQTLISMRDGSHSTASIEAPAMVAASGCAPPMPPRPPVRTQRPLRLPPKCWRPGFDEGLVGALHDALAADVDPGAGGHLAVHHQALGIELVEMLPGRPVRHQVGVGEQHARRVLVGLEHADRLAGLDQQRLVVVQPLQLSTIRSKHSQLRAARPMPP